MEQTNITHIPIRTKPDSPRPVCPANDAATGPIRLRIPKDVLDDHAKRHAAGLSTRAIALPEPGETLNILIGPNCGQRADLLGTIKTATCVLALDPERILVRFKYVEADPGTKAAWVTFSQLTFPDRNADCEVV